MYCFESVGLVYGLILIVFFSILREVSRNGSPAGLVSIVNLIVECRLFSQVRNSLMLEGIQMNIANMLSRYLFQRIV